MGIRVYCPNGHKLNIKATLAGRRGICPHCGTKFKIPATEEALREDGSNDDGPLAAFGTSETDDVGVDECNVALESPDAGPSTGQRPVAPGSTGQRPVAPGADPLTELPDAVWYLRPASGGQFGPMRTPAMRTWLENGRVTGDALVWREDWREWAVAGDVFVELGAAREPVGPSRSGGAWAGPAWEAAADVEPTTPTVIPSIKVVDGPTASPVFARRRNRRRSTYWVVGLSVVVVLLGIVLAWVLNRS